MLCEGCGGAVARAGLKIISVAVQQRQSSDKNMESLQQEITGEVGAVYNRIRGHEKE